MPSAAAMTQLRHHIAYTYQEMPGGGRVRRRDTYARLPAAHEFLRYEIMDRATGDSLQVTRGGGR